MDKSVQTRVRRKVALLRRKACLKVERCDLYANSIPYTLHHCPGRANTARDAFRPAVGCSPVFSGGVLGVWGYRGGHSPCSGAPRNTTGKNLIGMVFWGIFSYWGGDKCGSCIGCIHISWSELYKAWDLQGLGLILNSVGVTQMTQVSPECTPVHRVYSMLHLFISPPSIVSQALP